MGQGLIGYQRFTQPGNVLPTGTAVRVHYVHYMATTTATGLKLYDGVTSGTGSQIIEVQATDVSGIGNHDTTAGVLFRNGVWLDSAAAMVYAIVGFQTEFY